MEKIEIANLAIHPDEVQVLADGRRVGFTLREFELFSVLADRNGRVMRRAEIYSRIWGGSMSPRDRSVDVLVRKVRAKLERAAPGWEYIHTHFGIGYRFEPRRVEAAAVEPSSPLATRSIPASEGAPEAGALALVPARADRPSGPLAAPLTAGPG